MKLVWKLRISAAAVLGLCLACFGALFAQRDAVAAGAFDGILLCGRVVIPSLFPFIFAANLLSRTQASALLGRLIGPLMNGLFRVRGEAATSVLLSFLSGYPVSAQLMAGLYKRGDLGREDAGRLMRFCVNPGPAFAVSAVGGSILGSAKAGLIIWASVMTASVAMGIFSRPRKTIGAVRLRPQNSFPEAFCLSCESAAIGVATICAYTILFSAICAPLTALPQSEVWLKPILPALEITTGISRLGRAPLPAFAAYISFGGISVIFQLLSIGRELNLKFWDIALPRVICAALSAAVCRLLVCVFPVELGDLPAMGQVFKPSHTSPASSICLIFSVAVFLAYLGQIFSKKNQII